jgi:phage terminase large subunit
MTLDEIGDQLRDWRDGRGILKFVDDNFNVQPDWWQEEALLAFASGRPTERRISLQACAGPGKSAVLAWCAWWFLTCQGDVVEHPKGAAVSISKENLHDNLWAELAKWRGVSPLLRSQFTWTNNRVFSNDHPETWFLSARAWPKSANADEQGKTLSGIHSKYVLFLIDESGAIPTTVLRAAEQGLPNTIFGKIMQAGNPISLEGMLYAAANQLRHLWHIIKITGDPDDPRAWVHAPRVAGGELEGVQTPAQMAREQIQTYGRDNPWVMAYILGQFPPASINALIGQEAVEACMNLHVRDEEFNHMEKRLGIDVARFGDDRSVIFPRQGIVAYKPAIMRHQRTTEIAARAAYISQRWNGVDTIFVDDTGHWGHGVIDNLIDAGYPAIGVMFHADAMDRRYANRRAEMWVNMTDALKAGVALPNIAELVAELTTPTYTFVKGQFLLEEKDQIKKRLGRSPDLADALALTWALPDMPRSMHNKFRRNDSAKREFDPYAITTEGGRADHDFDPNDPNRMLREVFYGQEFPKAA